MTNLALRCALYALHDILQFKPRAQIVKKVARRANIKAGFADDNIFDCFAVTVGTLVIAFITRRTSCASNYIAFCCSRAEV